jgi:hypothetical protein
MVGRFSGGRIIEWQSCSAKWLEKSDWVLAVGEGKRLLFE